MPVWTGNEELAFRSQVWIKCTFGSLGTKIILKTIEMISQNLPVLVNLYHHNLSLCWSITLFYPILCVFLNSGNYSYLHILPHDPPWCWAQSDHLLPITTNLFIYLPSGYLIAPCFYYITMGFIIFKYYYYKIYHSTPQNI